MEEKTLIKLCLVTVVFGIVFMFSANKLIKTPLVNISDINTEYNVVRIKGEVSSITVSESETTFIKLKDLSGTIDVVVFRNSLATSQLKAGMLIVVLGKPDIYKGEVEIIASQIQVVDSDLV